MRRAGGALALAGLLIGVLSACGGPAGAKDGGDTVTLRVGATGWKREEALLKFAHLDDTPYQVRWSLFQGGDKQLEAVRAGALDVASSSEIPPVFAAADGRPNFKVVAVQRGNTLNQEVVAPKDSEITSIAQLKGKKVGYVKNTTAHYFLYELLKQAGLGWNDITAAPLEPDKALAALNGGSIDAFAGYGNAIIAAHQQGAHTIGDGADILSGNFLWSASDDTLGSAAEREALADLLARIDQAYAYVRDGHQEEYAKVIAAATHQPVEEALEEYAEGEAQRRTEVWVVTAKATASEQEVADAFEELGALKQPLKVSTFWTDRLTSPLRKALSS
ncbi:ABC transporter substrate-binding protein [Streptomyces ipomoeae]|uniref:Putative lipoprotein n=1 Tax=Streptomyces ipomoeae 91-03 TaxID=698759 RepID=L1KJY5_9ACTN|nr:ABC transporter substrate-binding protein [Streptomyces ipomoeae]EKX60869.1 putative lipoprotein [Streptomyces ipomoeae 91-03]MDX2697887.1 ABC transporter substrate-binding protein [Streptomyces ipomoeae]MDX2826766.1 ABC transporter substrate-binding protein [Streptomyces ipomoeae]MDX2843701.1 ABC transporter substrate-binding protein [Streptomyces ipomoeae]MDX2878576.1 ABC transporter substrate-binding protein [Streptomyces ipomoeae]